MKHLKTLCIFLAILVVSFVIVSTSTADYNINQYVTNFNSMNSGQGLLFNYSNSGYPGVSTHYEFWIKNTASSNDFANVSAYSTAQKTTGSDRSDGNQYFTSFCVAPNRYTRSGTVTGTLDYNVSTGRTTTSEGYALTVGAAYLYMSYATGQIHNVLGRFYSTNDLFPYGIDYERAHRVPQLQDAVQKLMGIQTLESSDWATTFLYPLVEHFKSLGYSAGDAKALLTQTYNVNEYYSFMDGNTVFVMRGSQSGTTTQDILFLAQVSPSGGNGGSDGVPEPATLLLWTFGSLGLVGGSYWKRKSGKR